MIARAGNVPLRVLAVDHTAAIAPSRRKFEEIAAHRDLDLTVFAPDRWVENYRVVRPGRQGPSPYRTLTGRVIWPGYENRAFFRAGLGSAIRRIRPDVIHLWEEPFSLITFQALWHAAFWARGVPILFHSADNLSGSFRYSYRPSWLYAAIERLAQRRCACGTAVSEEVADVLRSKGFRGRIEIVPLGVDPRGFAPFDPGAGAGGRIFAAARSGPGPETPVVGYAGRLLRQKGVDLLLRAVALLESPRPSLVILGDGPERAALQSLAADLGIAERTRFLPMAPHEEVPALLASIDVLVLPSRTTPLWKEQFGRVLVEGMAAGCVVVGSSSGSIPSVMGDAGLVFPEGDVAGLAAAIQRVLGDPGLASGLRRRGRERMLERFTWDSIAARLAALYRDLASGGRPATT